MSMNNRNEYGYVAMMRARAAIDDLTKLLEVQQAAGADAQVRPKSPLEAVSNLYRVRRMRDEVLGKDLFGEPTWDILLDLYAMHQQGRECSVKSVCIASAVAPTTALRWFNVLLGKGLLTRLDDPRDGRRSIVQMTEKGLRAMDELVARI
ncbi:hypothetical protein [Novosphingobium sp. BW1]|uniref:hypothetical protein n=1 Tax=Novosphingobium sp. BW1 TaxID=2592621 RepID=UPI0013968FA4|nr:hypothetical protein [Novosphingobium sp. BW1]